MLKTVEATIDEQGNVKLVEPVALPKPARAAVILYQHSPGKSNAIGV